MVHELPSKFINTILGLNAEEGRQWLDDLPKIIDEIKQNWNLTIGNPFQNLSYHYVVPCICADGSEAVLKIAFPQERKGFFNETKMLEFIGGKGLVKLLRIDNERFAMLLEKLTPGENLKIVCHGDDERAVRIAVKVMSELWREPPEDNDFQKIDDWFQGFQRAEKTEFNGYHLKKAHQYYESLQSLSEHKMVLHGDLHHENILSATREAFLAIDPKGIIGDVGYETSAFLINHARWLLAESNLKEKLENAVLILSEGLDIEQQKIKKWAYAQSVLSAWWTFEENCENWRDELAFAEIWE